MLAGSQLPCRILPGRGRELQTNRESTEVVLCCLSRCGDWKQLEDEEISTNTVYLLLSAGYSLM